MRVKTLSVLIQELQELETKGYGDKKIFYSHSSSGDTGNINGAYVTDYVGEAGPFDLDDGEEYISLSVGGN